MGKVVGEHSAYGCSHPVAFAEAVIMDAEAAFLEAAGTQFSSSGGLAGPQQLPASRLIADASSIQDHRQRRGPAVSIAGVRALDRITVYCSRQ
jgi:hypothetical protein